MIHTLLYRIVSEITWRHNKAVLIFVKKQIFDVIKNPKVFHKWCANLIDVVMRIYVFIEWHYQILYRFYPSGFHFICLDTGKILRNRFVFHMKQPKIILSLSVDNLFATHQWYNFVNIARACLCAISKLLQLVILAYNLTALCRMDLYKSFIYNKKNNGPNTEPCGTPHDTVPKSEFTPFMTMHWRLLVKYDLKKSLTSPRIPYHSSLYNKISWSTVSNAFLKSINILMTYLFIN